jgi:hypothetical protein
VVTVEDGGLLALAIEAHGGLRRWRALTSITARLSIGGELCQQKGWAGALDEIAITIHPHVQRVSFTPCTSLDRRGFFMPSRVAIETTDGDLVSERIDPRAAFDSLDPGDPWDALHLAYFVGCTMWTRLTVPFLLAEPGVVIHELDPWREDGATWKRVRAIFPERIASHRSEQILYFSPEGLLRRHDYTLDCISAAAIGEYTDEHQIYGGISFPTLRRAVKRQPDGTTEPDPALVTIDISDITTSTSGSSGIHRGAEL